MDFRTCGLDGAAYMEKNIGSISATNLRKRNNGDGTVDIFMDVYNIPAPSVIGCGKNAVGALAALNVKKKDNTYYSKIPYLIPGRKISSNLFLGVYEAVKMEYESATDEYPFGQDARDASIAKKTSLKVRAPSDGTIVISKSNFDAYCLNVVDMLMTTFDLAKSVSELNNSTSYASFVQAVRMELVKPLASGGTGMDVLTAALQRGDYTAYSSAVVNLGIRAVQDYITSAELRKALIKQMGNSIGKKYGEAVWNKMASSKLPAVGQVIAAGDIVFSIADVASQIYDLQYWVNNCQSDYNFCTLTIPVSQIPLIPQ
jgi:hypothetical protein